VRREGLRERGCVSFKTFAADDGARISVAGFESNAHPRAWREHAFARDGSDERA
jgi:hypothetical protein